ncbi:hypothetical protein [Nesterenkonia jeotgali]|uniref:Uncharacterized protein n=1 Tax=Nesterenkonia jeotgali TaxID=317018 RepID=A0A0W8IG80_9MICC|nr:hypothetical protein [Nesterenkonia jeotgali]KUG58988.1 hypothetical protein AVL63_02905 [Nesterenkonia jeotgali]
MPDTLTGANDHGMQLLAYTPGRGTQPMINSGEVHNIRDVTVGYGSDGTPQSLQFTTTKDSPGAEYLQEPVYSFVLRLWDPRAQRWVEPVNSRFIFPSATEDTADESNTITYRLVSELKVLDKVRLHRMAGDAARNDAYDRALERYQDAERDFDRELRGFEDIAHRVKRRHGFWGGKVFAYRGVAWINSSHSVPRGSIASDASRNGRLFYWNGSSWRGLSLAQWADDKQTMRERGVEVSKARNLMNQRRQVLDRAERGVRETSRGGRRYFYNSAPGRTLARFWKEESGYDAELGHGSGGATIMKSLWRSFTNARDSKGRNWTAASRTHHEFALGSSMLAMLQDFRQRGLVDYQLRGRAFDLVPRGGFEVDQSRRVILQLGQDVEGAPERWSTDHHYSVAVVVGGSGYSYRSVYGPTIASNNTPWGFLAGAISDNDVNSLHSANNLTREERAAANPRIKVEASRSLVLSASSAIPMIDYEPHHWIGVYDHDGSVSKRRIDHIALTWSPDQPLRAVITLDTRFQRAAVQYGRTLSKTLGGVDHLQGHIPINPELAPPLAWEEPPYAPPITDVAARVRFDPLTGQPSVIMTAQWSDAVLPEPEDPTAGEAELLDTGDYDPETDDGFEPGDPDDDEGIPETVEVD